MGVWYARRRSALVDGDGWGGRRLALGLGADGEPPAMYVLSVAGRCSGDLRGRMGRDKGCGVCVRNLHFVG